MTMSVPERNSGSGGKEEESEDESEILEESPCGRWQKRKEQVGARLAEERLGIFICDISCADLLGRLGEGCCRVCSGVYDCANAFLQIKIH